MTVTELLEKLAPIAAEGQGDAEVWVEGCDCNGVACDVHFEPDMPAYNLPKSVLITR